MTAPYAHAFAVVQADLAARAVARLRHLFVDCCWRWRSYISACRGLQDRQWRLRTTRGERASSGRHVSAGSGNGGGGGLVVPAGESADGAEPGQCACGNLGREHGGDDAAYVARRVCGWRVVAEWPRRADVDLDGPHARERSELQDAFPHPWGYPCHCVRRQDARPKPPTPTSAPTTAPTAPLSGLGHNFWPTRENVLSN